jgi:predicted ribosome quality control (RQC) complex YloA/Tae2 family protein
MIINSTLVFCFVPELEEAFKGSKITQILLSSDRKQLLLVTRSKENEASLFFCAHPQDYRIEILDGNETKTKRADYEKTNLFSYAVGAYVEGVEQVDFDRVIRISCLRKSQLGPNIEFDLVLELTGRNANLILVRKDGLIIDCLRKVDLTQNRFRQVLPGEKYAPPPPPKKKNPFHIENDEFVKLIKTHDLPVSELLTTHFVGLDELSAKKIMFEASVSPTEKTGNLNEQEIEALWRTFHQTFEEIAGHKFSFQVVADEDGKAMGISCVSLPFLEDRRKISCQSLNSAVKKFFPQKREEEQKKVKLKRFSGIARGAQKRLERRKGKIEEDLEQAEKFEQYKRFGDLLMMSKDRMKRGQESVKLTNIFDPQQNLVDIRLNPKLSPIHNAQAYFKKYKKAKDSLAVMRKRKAETEKEIAQLQKISEKLSEEGKEQRLPEIGKELVSLGLLKEKKAPGKKRKDKKEFSPRTFVSKNGSEILVGRNNKENDYLTFRFARPDDLWFHAQDVPGSHVILRRKEKKKEPSHTDIREAAQVAAHFSKARGEKKAPVIYTQAKYVKKPKKGKPGLALVDREKTILVEPGLPEN